jgi:hypothetical protein
VLSSLLPDRGYNQRASDSGNRKFEDEDDNEDEDEWGKRA